MAGEPIDKREVAEELSKIIKPRIWYLLSIIKEKSYPTSLQDKYQFILDLISK